MALGKLSERVGKVTGQVAEPVVEFLDFGTVPVTSVVIEAVIGGVRQQVTFGAPYGPLEAVEAIRAWDPAAVFHTELRSASSWGSKRETKSAVCQSVTLKKSDKGLFGDFTCVTSDGEVIVVGITKKFDVSAKFAGVLNADRMEQLTAFMGRGGSLPLLLRDEERFTVRYWTTEDGMYLVDDLAR